MPINLVHLWMTVQGVVCCAQLGVRGCITLELMSAPPNDQPPLSGPYLPSAANPSNERGHNQPRQTFGSLPSMRPNLAPTTAQPEEGPAPRPQIARTRRRLAPLLVIGLALISVVALLLSGWGTRTQKPSAGGSASPSATVSPVNRTPAPGTLGTVVVSPDGAEAWWEILKVTWDTQGVTLDVRITAESGTLGYSFFALDNTYTTSHDPDLSVPGALVPGRVSAPDSVRGIVRFDKFRGDTTVIIATPAGRQITALVVNG